MSRLGNGRGFTILELLIVNCIIAIIAAFSLVIYKNQIERARSIVLVHDLTYFSRKVALASSENSMLPFSEGDEIDDSSPFFRLSRNVSIEIVSMDDKNPFAGKDFIAAGILDNIKIYIDLKTGLIINDKKNRTDDFLISRFFKYFLYFLGGGLIFFSTILTVLRTGSRKK